MGCDHPLSDVTISSSDGLFTSVLLHGGCAANEQERKAWHRDMNSYAWLTKLSDRIKCVWKGEAGSSDLRGDGNLGPCLLLDLLQVAALLSNQPAYVVVASDDLQRDVFHPTHTHTQSYDYTR